MKTSEFSNSFIACLWNGERLFDDAQLLYDFGRVASAYALSMLSQEEFAKAFLMELVRENVIPWRVEVWKSMQDHTCKQLLVLIMEFLNPSIDDFLTRIKSDSWNATFPPHVADAINIYRREKIGRWKSPNWVWTEPPDYDATAKKVADGNLDRTKQNALYVRLAKTGEVAGLPSSVTIEMAENELEKARRLHQLIVQIKEGSVTMLYDYENLKETLRLIFKNITPVGNNGIQVDV